MSLKHSLIAATTIIATISIYKYFEFRKSQRNAPKSNITELIGDTPVVLLPKLSALLNCKIFAKLEFLNIGGSPKDRVALSIITTAEREGDIVPNIGYTLYEGTVGSTGIALALLARQKGYNCKIFMPDDVAIEKRNLLNRLGAVVQLVPPASIIDPNHFVNVAKREASLDTRGFFCNQFENRANFDAHYNGTGRELYECFGDELDAVVMGAGTGGTLAGITHYLKQRTSTKSYLADPQGSGLFNKVMHGVMYTDHESEGARKRHQIDSIVEGVGLTRLTNNFKSVSDLLDGAFKVSDQEAVSMSRLLVDLEGLFVGSSSAVNMVGVVKAARLLGSGSTIVTLLCDGGQRHLTKFWSDSFLLDHGFDISTPHNLDFIS